MRKIKILIWQGLCLPKNDMGANVVIHQDPSDQSGTLSVVIKDASLFPYLQNIFFEEMDDPGLQKDFFTSLNLKTLKNRFRENFSVSFIESIIKPRFVGGGRETFENKL